MLKKKWHLKKTPKLIRKVKNLLDFLAYSYSLAIEVNLDSM